MRQNQKDRTRKLPSNHQINLPKQEQYLYHNGIFTNGRSILLSEKKIRTF